MAGGPSIKCPCCSQALYRVAAAMTGFAALSRDSPIIQSDAKGHFMKCPHCRRRVVFVEAAGQPDGIEFALAPEQPCSDDI